MFGLGDKLANHGLDDTNVAVEKTTKCATEQSNPNVGGETDHDHTEHGTYTAKDQDGLAADSVGEATPVHAHDSLGQRKGRDEDTRVEGGILFVTKIELFDQGPGVWIDGSKGDWFREADNG